MFLGISVNNKYEHIFWKKGRVFWKSYVKIKDNKSKQTNKKEK